MTILDWSIIALFLVFTVSIGLYFARRAGSDTSEFFLSGRNLPWWLAGLSMVATTFAADTPLAVTELVAINGIAGNWLWWNMCIGGMLTVFFFARLWRRAGILTDMEFIELRYSGRTAAFLRGFRALYLGLFMNCVIIGWVNVAMGSVLKGMFGLSDGSVFLVISIAMFCTAAYSALSGLWGVAVTDAFQFAIAMIGCIVLALFVLHAPEVGGIAGLQSKLPPATFRFFPVIGSGGDIATGVFSLSAGAFIAHIGIQWWASWYPGAEPGGGGYVAQRMMSAKDERHSVLATLLFQIAHYCIRPWPWILVGLASMVLYPDLGVSEKKMGYILAMNEFLPSGVKGLLLAAFFAAYMSTIATHLNWGTSYIVHDFWRRFVQRKATEKQYVLASRVTTILVMAISLMITSIITTIAGAWQFLIECGAGLGLVLIARWYWWRINAWSEITATIAPIVGYLIIALFNGQVSPENQVIFPATLYILVPWTTIAWIIATYVTKPTDSEVLARFYQRVRPGGRFWRPVREALGSATEHVPFKRLLLSWIAGIMCIYATLFGVGSIFFGNTIETVLWFALASAGGVLLSIGFTRTSNIVSD